MADIKISALPTLGSAGAQGSDVIPVVDNSSPGAQVTKKITLTDLTNYITGQIPPSTPSTPPTYNLPPGSGLGYYQKEIFQRSSIVPATPPNQVSPAGWYISDPGSSGNDVLWSCTALIDPSEGGSLVNPPGAWSAPIRKGAGQVIFYSPTQPTAGYIQDGDLWYNTANNNVLKIYQSGAWVLTTVPFPYVDANGNMTGIVQVNGNNNGNVTLVAEQFQIVSTEDLAGSTYKTAPFKILNITAPAGTTFADGTTNKHEIFMDGTHVTNLDAGSIIGGTIQAGVKMQTPLLEAGAINNNFGVYNDGCTRYSNTATSTNGISIAGRPYYTMPTTGYVTLTDGGTYPITQGGAPLPQNSAGTEQWWNGSYQGASNISPLTFWGWNTGPTGYIANRFGCPGNGEQLFLYNWQAYTDGTDPLMNGNLVYRIVTSYSNNVVGWGPTCQVQFQQADLAGGGRVLQQHGALCFRGNNSETPTPDGTGYLNGICLIQFGWRVASVGTGSIIWSSINVTAVNI